MVFRAWTSGRLVPYFVHAVLSILMNVMSVKGASEISWGDVASDGSLTTRSLDIPVAIARGVENFFQTDPMEAHDWTHVKFLNRSLWAHLRLASGTRKTKLDEIETALKPINEVMPKNEFGFLSNSTARYALHRFFREKHGWSIKGLEPAGGSWVKSLAVTPDVKDMTKYMMPSYIQEILMRDVHEKGFSLRSLAILASTIEHLIRIDTISILYSVYATLEHSTADRKGGKELNEIIDAFMIVYAFGVNLDVTSSKDLAKAQEHLNTNHMGWRKMQEFTRDTINSFANPVFLGTEKIAFAGVLDIALQIGKRYAQWQNRDCERAKQELVAMPELRDGRIPVSRITASHADGYRSLFVEKVETLRQFGVLASTTERDPQGELIISNFLNSQAMCLSTANFYTVCCVNECDSIMKQLETEIRAPSSKPQQLADAFRNLKGPATMDQEQFLKELHAIAAANDGQVPLQGRDFAELLHRTFPLECPAPHDQKTTNPKTPDEWMEEPHFEIQDTDDMMREISEVLARYTAMSISSEHATWEEELQSGSDIVKIVDKQSQTPEVVVRTRRAFAKLVYITLGVSMFGFAATIARTIFIASYGKSEKNGKAISTAFGGAWGSTQNVA